MKSLSCVQLFVAPRTAAYQAPPSMGFSRQEYWSGVPLPSPIYLLGVTKNLPRFNSSTRGFCWEGLKLASSLQAFSKQLKDNDKLMLFLEINTLVPLCHQLQTIIKIPLQNQGASLIAQLVKNPSATQKTPVLFLGREDPLEKGLAAHSSILGF